MVEITLGRRESENFLNRYRVKSSIGGSVPPLSAIYLTMFLIPLINHRN